MSSPSDPPIHPNSFSGRERRIQEIFIRECDSFLPGCILTMFRKEQIECCYMYHIRTVYIYIYIVLNLLYPFLYIDDDNRVKALDMDI